MANQIWSFSLVMVSVEMVSLFHLLTEGIL